MKKKCKLLFISVLTIVFLFYRADSVVAMANEEPEQIVETPSALNTTSDFVSNGPALIEWMETHKDIGGMVKLTDHVVLEEDYTYCPNGINRPTVFVDTDQYTITVTGEIELLSDNHLIFSGQPDGKSIFYVAPKGVLSVMGVAVESGQCALWQEEGAGLVMEDCRISGNIHYADTPFVIYQNAVYVVVEKEQIVNDVLPTEISCTVNRQGNLSHNEPMLLSWNLEGSENQQAKRRRFQLQGSFVQAASAEPALCTVAYNDYPLTFLEVTATDDGTRYTFRGGYTKPEEALPITVISEYSFDGENWIAYGEEYVTHTEAGFFIGFRSEECDRAAYSNIYIRLQWNDNGTRYFSNVLCYAADNLEHVEDIGGSRGGGTSIINQPEDPQEKSGDTAADEGADQNADRNSDSGNAKSEASSDTNQAESGDGGSSSGVVNDGQPSNAGNATNTAYTGKSSYAESSKDQPFRAEAQNAEQSSHSGSKTDNNVTQADNPDNTESISRSDFDSSEKAENGAILPKMNEQTLRSDIRTGNAIFIAIGGVLLSVIAGIAGFCVHSRFGTNR